MGKRTIQGKAAGVMGKGAESRLNRQDASGFWVLVRSMFSDYKHKERKMKRYLESREKTG